MVAEYKSAGSSCVVCSQDVSAASSAAGPFTGEVTAGLLKDMDIEWTIIGHSERRGGGPLGIDERRELINRKLKAALAAGLKVIVCIGESGGRDTNYVIQQLEASHKAVTLNNSQDICTGITDSDDRLVIAYEPGGCVGTDRPAAPEEVNETITSIKSMAKCNVTRSRFIYGGSVDRSNASLYTRQPNVDGIMVGRLWQHPEFEPLLETI
ncbi:new-TRIOSEPHOSPHATE ISOMERASE, putative [Babesia bigemina]|uniref:Triosephosphate isomerase n=1 Tax=Babesia bigemina TaxID=5866 RepID=A0A061DE11_BABBI|nr:new-TRIOSEPHOSPHATE ISOMERASE, putative [Babesia bigemina]CDR96750.1 new-TRIOSEPHOSPHATE ISOMERASE, putative [Babesia bigemina]|eukprot:XP_012768936.1 new-TRIOSEPHOSPHATE ISOMERASE, putative [Babesia bigemina]